MRSRFFQLGVLSLSGFVTSFGAHIVATNLPAYAETVGAGAFMIGLLINHDRARRRCGRHHDHHVVSGGSLIVLVIAAGAGVGTVWTNSDALGSIVMRQRLRPAFPPARGGHGRRRSHLSPSSPWQNPYVERLIGSIRRECLDHAIVLNARHLRRILTIYSRYDHRSRTHLGLEKKSPDRRPVSSPAAGPIIAIPEVGGLHHRHERQAA